ncbi:MAG: hypothetical protein ILP19_00020, partial [Oscillospiraceae bacterium]|nr:hypothetical protein [Oscillospiraceae bacterium]
MKQRAFQAAAIIAVLAAVFAVLYIAAGLWDDSTVMIDNKTYSTGDRSLTLVLLTEDGIEDIGRFDRLESLDIMPYKVSARLAVEADKYISPEDAAKAMQQIDELYGGCTDIADISFLAQSDLHDTLKSLDLSYCAVGDISV